MFICFIVSIVFFVSTPRLGWIYDVKDYFHKVSIESNEKFLNNIQTEINNQPIPSYLIDTKASERRVKELKTKYVVVLVKNTEGAITKNEVGYFLDVARSKKFKNVNLLFYDKSKENSVDISMNFENGVTFCYPNMECEDLGVKENE
ncbi:hypothetical protein [Paenibacillus donghaensis]|nr:hypothetical protein [Paenibacillus donghaensis]